MKHELGTIDTVKKFDKWLRERGFTRREARALSFTFNKLYATKDNPRRDRKREER
jgi:hypothetical protein